MDVKNGALSLFLVRDRARPSCLRAPAPLKKEQQMVNVEVVGPCLKEQVECFAHGESGGPICSSSSLSSNSCPEVYENESSAEMKSEAVKEHFRDTEVVIPESRSVLKEVSSCERELLFGRKSEAFRQDQEEHTNRSKEGPSVTNSSEKVSSIAMNLDTVGEDTTEWDMACNKTCQSVLEKEVSLCCKKDFSVSHGEDNEEESDSVEDSGNMDMVESESTSYVAMDVEIHSNGHAPAADETDSQVEYALQLDSGTSSLLSEASKAEHHKSSKRMLTHHTSDFQDGNGVKRIEIMGNNSL